jgi:hypothetical protein
MTKENRENLEIEHLRKQLSDLQRRKTQRKRCKRVPTGNPRGRRRIAAAKIETARQLAAEFPIPDVALMTNISKSTLYRNDIKRYKLPALVK